MAKSKRTSLRIACLKAFMKENNFPKPSTKKPEEQHANSNK